ncbi:hypothetical protein [Glaciimonas immobilis]|uniref:Uncharacterized protein n=1 Tax=Glaciimonas immobilis TaxID=728004 RepID=A0A840RRC0_9BURK|nr:hypothetical protein [Glaciimonas immobilis]KAF3999836.1 hypothetical protein HAV38_01210 [Glaciimonas immobilis]MBB5200315.1 hypothetical protein [Glaciimonas immobilis]
MRLAFTTRADAPKEVCFSEPARYASKARLFLTTNDHIDKLLKNTIDHQGLPKMQLKVTLRPMILARGGDSSAFPKTQGITIAVNVSGAEKVPEGWLSSN